MRTDTSSSVDPDVAEDPNPDVVSLFTKQLKEGRDDGSKPDYTNLRLQLWTAMSEFPEQCQPKSRVFVPLLFRFLK